MANQRPARVSRALRTSTFASRVMGTCGVLETSSDMGAVVVLMPGSLPW